MAYNIFSFPLVLFFALIALPSAIAQPKALILDAHSSTVFTARFSPNGAFVATGGNDHRAYLWSATDGTQLHNLIGHTGHIAHVEFSPDSKWLLTASADATIGLWETATGNLITMLYGHTANVNTAFFSANGERFATASNDKTAKIWDVEQRKLVATLEGHTARVEKAVFSNDNTKVATAGGDGTAKVWNAASGALITTVTPVHTGLLDIVYSVEFSPDGTWLLTSQSSDSSSVWDIASASLRYSVAGRIAAFSPDGTQVVAASTDKITVYNAATGTEIYSAQQQEPSHSARAIFFPNGTTPLVTTSGIAGSNSWSVRVIDVQKNTVPYTLTGHTLYVYSTDISPDGNSVVTASNDATARLWLGSTTSDDAEQNSTPLAFTVSYLPHAHSIRTTYVSTAAQPVAIALYSFSGKEVTTIVNGVLPVGEHVLSTPIPLLPSGVYYAIARTQHKTVAYPVHIVQ